MKNKLQKILYLDCTRGVAGNMLLAALCELTNSHKNLEKELKAKGLKNFSIKISVKKEGIISATYIEVVNSEKIHRNYNDICSLINKTKFSKSIKQKSIEIFYDIAKCESKVHKTAISKIHFHEIGATDSIVDILGGLYLIEKINPDLILSSTLNLGGGTVKCQHGIIPVPAPATLKLLENSKVKIFSDDTNFELTTPTGAALIKNLAKDFVSLPTATLKTIGYGTGKYKTEKPNILTAYILENNSTTKTDDNLIEENIYLLETNIDDLSPQHYDFIMEKLYENNALEVYLTPVIMKKSRPAVLLSVMCYQENFQKIIQQIFTHTTTLGIRYQTLNRVALKREINTIKTKYGNIKIKTANFAGGEKMIPEYEDIKNVALKRDITINEVLKTLRREFYE